MILLSAFRLLYLWTNVGKLMQIYISYMSFMKRSLCKYDTVCRCGSVSCSQSCCCVAHLKVSRATLTFQISMSWFIMNIFKDYAVKVVCAGLPAQGGSERVHIHITLHNQCYPPSHINQFQFEFRCSICEICFVWFSAHAITKLFTWLISMSCRNDLKEGRHKDDVSLTSERGISLTSERGSHHFWPHYAKRSTETFMERDWKTRREDARQPLVMVWNSGTSVWICTCCWRLQELKRHDCLCQCPRHLMMMTQKCE